MVQRCVKAVRTARAGRHARRHGVALQKKQFRVAEPQLNDPISGNYSKKLRGGQNFGRRLKTFLKRVRIIHFSPYTHSLLTSQLSPLFVSSSPFLYSSSVLTDCSSCRGRNADWNVITTCNNRLPPFLLRCLAACA